MFFDSHAHLNFVAFDKDRDEVIRQCLKNDIWLINVGSNYETSKKAAEIAEKYSRGVFASVGLHPINLDTGLLKTKTDELEGKHFEKEFDCEKYRELAKSPTRRVVAIGEIGLDYYYKPKTKKKLEEFKEKQKALLLKQIELAKEMSLPIIFHCRMAHEDLIKLLNLQLTTYNLQLKGVIHCFTGDWQEAQKYLEMGFYLGFNGIIFKPAPHRTEGSGAGLNLDEVIKKTPLEKILIETDCPYLTSPNFGEERNNPLGVKFIAEYIAKIKNLSFEKVAKITTENAKKLFRI